MLPDRHDTGVLHSWFAIWVGQHQIDDAPVVSNHRRQLHPPQYFGLQIRA